MPVNVKITTDTSGLSQGLDKAKKDLKDTGASATNSAEALDSFGDNADNAVRALDSIAGAAGAASSGFSGLGGDIIALVKNPIAMLIAAIAVVATRIKDAFDNATVDGNQLFKMFEWSAKRADEQAKTMMEQLSSSNAYIQTLDKLLVKERLTNAERMQAIQLLLRLKETYKDLSIQIGQSGQIYGDWNEQKRMLFEQRRLIEAQAEQSRLDRKSRLSGLKLNRQVDDSTGAFQFDKNLVQLLTDDPRHSN